MRMLAFVCGVFAICTCAASELHVIGGAKTKFCLPDINKVADVPWVPEDLPGTPSAFAFAGCATMSDHHVKDCGTPSSIVGGLVEAKSAYRSQRWGDVGVSALLKKIASAPGAELKPAQDGAVVIVHNEKLWKPDWFIWGKARRLASQTKPHLEDDDVLLASCHYLPTMSFRSFGAYVFDCDRSILAGDYALQYTYRSETLVPADLKSLDAAMIAAIDQWRCD
ncbi:hypothetical protein [Dyella choica]|uniref:Uncharacterized protein n=1 Tax=Dyella choica TaxID=1927959 RepID=A0A432M8L6_9GAMM|nr:hypothetical protein [Dyella choica]RUL78224.1 hypothetical protein EKH80_05130 [Dyella choica]